MERVRNIAVVLVIICLAPCYNVSVSLLLLSHREIYYYIVASPISALQLSNVTSRQPIERNDMIAQIDTSHIC